MTNIILAAAIVVLYCLRYRDKKQALKIEKKGELTIIRDSEGKEITRL